MQTTFHTHTKKKQQYSTYADRTGGLFVKSKALSFRWYQTVKQHSIHIMALETTRSRQSAEDWATFYFQVQIRAWKLRNDISTLQENVTRLPGTVMKPFINTLDVDMDDSVCTSRICPIIACASHRTALAF